MRLSVVTVTYNSSAVIGGMLQSLPMREDTEVILVDNNSTDQSVAVALEAYSGLKVVLNPSNNGFAHAVNRGASASSGDYLLLVNPDARISAGDVEACLAKMDADPGIAILAPLVRHPQGRLRTLEAGRAPGVWRLFTHYSGLSRLRPGWRWTEGLYLRDVAAVQSREVDWVSGACMFIRTAAWSELGGLTERWFMYAEDVDLCLRAQDAGAKVWLDVDARATHEMGSSSVKPAKAPVDSRWLLNLYDLYKIRYHPNVFSRRIWRFVAVAGMLSRAGSFSMKGRRDRDEDNLVNWAEESRKFRGHAKAIWRAERTDL